MTQQISGGDKKVVVVLNGFYSDQATSTAHTPKHTKTITLILQAEEIQWTNDT